MLASFHTTCHLLSASPFVNLPLRRLTCGKLTQSYMRFMLRRYRLV